jgi:peroxin-7
MGVAAPRTVHDQHTEFIMGTAWALFDEGLLASCAWDQEVHLFKA